VADTSLRRRFTSLPERTQYERPADQIESSLLRSVGIIGVHAGAPKLVSLTSAAAALTDLLPDSFIRSLRECRLAPQGEQVSER
jgi:hypothetical protein